MEAADPRIEKVVSLVHRLDKLRGERSKLDGQIAEVTRELAQLTGVTAAGGQQDQTVIDAEAEAEAKKGPTFLGSSYADIAQEFVSKNPKATYSQIAEVLYKTADEAAKNKARSVMYFLSKKSRVRRRPDESWEVLGDDER